MASPVSEERLKKIFSKIDWKIIAMAIIFLFAIFLRTYHFHDWLFFKMDQARDAFTTQRAYNLGPGYLPLLGPKAGGTTVNLGPFFYYFQYLSAVIFHSVHPPVLAFPDLFFNILAIPLLYFFLRKYFNRDWSIILAGLYALCFLGIEYSRFAWNPNSLPFFNILFFYSLLNIFDQNRKYELRWYILAGLAFAISTQLHFLSFFTLPLLTLIFIILNRKELKKTIEWKGLLVFIVIIFLAYLPVILNELHSNFRDSKAFMDALHSKPSDHGIFENISRNIVYFGTYWATILLGVIVSTNSNNLPYLVWIIFILPAIYLNWKYWKGEKDALRKKFLLITLIWLPVYFLGYIPIAYQIRPRFFLPMLPLPFIFLGYVCQYFLWQKRKFVPYLAFVLAGVVLVGNVYGTYAWFKEMKDAQKKGIYPQRTIILKARDGITLWHLENTANYIATTCPLNTIYYNTVSEYHRPIKYLLGLANKNGLAIADMPTGDPSGCYYTFKRTRVKDNSMGELLDSEFSVVGERKFGAWTVLTLKLNDNYSGQPLPSFHAGRQTSSESEDTSRVFWKDIFTKKKK